MESVFLDIKSKSSEFGYKIKIMVLKKFLWQKKSLNFKILLQNLKPNALNKAFSNILNF